jgi:hypothetical protein
MGTAYVDCYWYMFVSGLFDVVFRVSRPLLVLLGRAAAASSTPDEVLEVGGAPLFCSCIALLLYSGIVTGFSKAVDGVVRATRPLLVMHWCKQMCC